MTEWTLVPGSRIKRANLHEMFGGSRQAGISCSSTTPNILLFSSSAGAERAGYVSCWKGDGCFHYTGEGMRGDQRMVQGNLAILEAEKRGKALRVFDCAAGDVEYRGRFTLDSKEPSYMDEGPELGSGPLRSVIVFRLRPLDTISAGVTTRLYSVSSERIITDVTPKLRIATAALAERLKGRPEGVHDLTPRQFEELIGELLTDMSIGRVEITPYTRDGGKDLLAYIDVGIGRLLFLIETKKYHRGHRVGVDPVRSLYGVVAAEDASHGTLITTSTFTKGAKEFQSERKHRLSLRDYNHVADWVRCYRTRR